MALFGKPMSVAAATAALHSAERRLADFEAERTAALNAADAEPEFDAGLAFRDRIPPLDRKIDSAKAALGHARAALDEAKEAEAAAAIDAQGKTAERAAREAAKLTLEIGDDAQRLAAKLARMAELNASVESYNKARGSRPHIVNGEARVREVPEKVIPAVYEEVTVWEDGAGNRPYRFRRLSNGDLVPEENGYMARREKVVSRAEQVAPAHIPGGRFTDGFKLIGLKGERLFPAGR